MDDYLGVPVILGKDGIERIIELELDDDDKERFQNSQEEVGKTESYERNGRFIILFK